MLPAIAHSRYRMLSERYLFFQGNCTSPAFTGGYSKNDESMLQPDRMMWVRKENRQQSVGQKYDLWTVRQKLDLMCGGEKPRKPDLQQTKHVR